MTLLELLENAATVTSRGLNAWLTYCAHGLIWALGAGLLARYRHFSATARNLIWKVAVFAPVFSALLALIRPVTGGYEDSGVALPHLPTVMVSANAAGVSWVQVGGALSFTILLGIGRWLMGCVGLWRRLSARSLIADAGVIQRLEKLRARTRLGTVRLTQSGTIASPLVLGLREICLPSELPSSVGEAELDAVLAHELSHLERWDGVWFPLVSLLQSALLLQPLNHWLASQYRSTAELACDDRAVELTRDPLGLAKALLQVATSATVTAISSHVPAMARAKSSLVVRVERLTRAQVTPIAGDYRAQRWAVVALGALGLLSASFSVEAAHPLSSAKAPPQPRSAGTPNAASLTRQLGALAVRAEELESQLAAESVSDGQANAAASVRMLELQQELSHVRGTAAWLEEQATKEVR